MNLLSDFFLSGMIWSRYSLVITPVNYNLFGVNLFLAVTGLFQLARIYRYTVVYNCCNHGMIQNISLVEH